MFPWVLAEFRQGEWEMVRQYMAEKYDGKAGKPRPRSTPCKSEGCKLQAPPGQAHCSTHHRQAMAAAVREASARREGSR